MDISEIRNTIVFNAGRIKKLGNWPEFVDEDSILQRIPNGNDAPGFDAGVACALDLIPRDRQRLSASLHGAYTTKLIKQIKKEIKKLEKVSEFAEKRSWDLEVSPAWDEAVNTETCWWLAASSICEEDDGDEARLMCQIEEFKRMIDNDYHRYMSSMKLVDELRNSYNIVDNVAVATKNGGMQAAYIDGHDIAIMSAYGIWFVGTHKESLGIPNTFKWSSKKDKKGRAMSGPAANSKQFVKCADFAELAQVLKLAKSHLGV